jgi:hypothetical protein
MATLPWVNNTGIVAGLTAVATLVTIVGFVCCATFTMVLFVEVAVLSVVLSVGCDEKTTIPVSISMIKNIFSMCSLCYVPALVKTRIVPTGYLKIE